VADRRLNLPVDSCSSRRTSVALRGETEGRVCVSSKDTRGKEVIGLPYSNYLVGQIKWRNSDVDGPWPSAHTRPNMYCMIQRLI
jgi:hypothetical protein